MFGLGLFFGNGNGSQGGEVNPGVVELMQWLTSVNFPSNELIDENPTAINALFRDGPYIEMDTIDSILIDGKQPFDVGAYIIDATIDFTVKGFVEPDSTGSKRIIASANPNNVQGMAVSFLNDNIQFEKLGVVEIASTGTEFSSWQGFRLDWVQSTTTFSLYTLTRAQYINNDTGTLVGTHVAGFSSPEGFQICDGLTSGFATAPYKGGVADFEIINGQRSIHWTCDQRSRHSLLDVSTIGPRYLGQINAVSGEDVIWGGDQNHIHNFEMFGGSRVIDFGLQTNPAGYLQLNGCRIDSLTKTLELRMKYGGGQCGNALLLPAPIYGVGIADNLTPTGGSLDMYVGNIGDAIDIQSILGIWVWLKFNGNGDISVDYLDGNGYISLGNTGGTVTGLVWLTDWTVGMSVLEGGVDEGNPSANMELAEVIYSDTGGIISHWNTSSAYDSKATVDAGLTGILLDSVGGNHCDIFGCKFSFYPVQDITSNVVLNGGFENDFDDWDDTTSAPQFADISTTEFYEGLKSLHMEQASNGGGNVSQDIPLFMNTKYEIKFALKTNMTAGSAVIDTDDDFDDVAQVTQGGVQDWTVYGPFVVDSGPITSTKIRCFLSNSGVGEAWYDIISFRPVDDGNLLDNASFESGGNTPDSWTESPSGSGLRRVSDESHTGDFSERVRGDGANTTLVLYQNTDLQTNTYYELSVWIHTLDWISGNAVFDTDDKFDGTCQFIPDSVHDWTKFTGRFFSGTETSLLIRIIRDTDLDGDVYFDDVTVRAIASAPVGTGVITNPAVTGDTLLNNGPSTFRQQGSDPELLSKEFWSDDGVSFDNKTWGDFWEQAPNSLFVWPAWTKVLGFCMLKSVATTVEQPPNVTTKNFLTAQQNPNDCGTDTAP